jgi:hypothetical protein
MTAQPTDPGPTGPQDGDLTREQRQAIMLEEQERLHADRAHFVERHLNSPRWRRAVRTVALLYGVMGAAAGGLLAVNSNNASTEVAALSQDALGVLLGAGAGLVIVAMLASLVRPYLLQRLRRSNLVVQRERLQDELTQPDEFFTNLVRINFKFIEEYYAQTRAQADKSFILSAIAMLVSLALIVTGVILVYRQGTPTEAQKWAAAIAAISGMLGQSIAAVFFYLYNNTVAKMGEYHQKLVLTQNLGLALRIMQDLPEGEQRTTAQLRLIESLTTDINSFLTSTRGPGRQRGAKAARATPAERGNGARHRRRVPDA